MTENTNKKKFRPLRAALICAAAVAMMVVSVAAANPEGAQELWFRVVDIVSPYRHQVTVTASNGESWTLMALPQTGVDNRDGRAILVIDGKEAADITDALTGEGSFTYEESGEDELLVITVTGSVDNWTLTTSLSYPGLGDPGMTSVVSSSDPSKKIFLDENGEVMVESYTVMDGDCAALDENAVVGFCFTTTSEVPQP